MLRKSVGPNHHYLGGQKLVVGEEVSEGKAVALIKAHCAVDISTEVIPDKDTETPVNRPEGTLNQLTKNFNLEELTNKAKEIGLPVAEKDTKKLISEAILKRRKVIEDGVEKLMDSIEDQEIVSQAGDCGIEIKEGADIKDVATALVIHNLKEATAE